MNLNMTPMRKKTLLMCSLLLLGFGVGWFSGTTYMKRAHPHHRLHRLSGYRYINPLLECDSGDETIGATELQPFRHTLEAYIAEKKQAGWASQTSIYFRDMNNGLAFGIEQGEKFTPASLLKVPLMMAYLKWAETTPGLLSSKLRFQGMPSQAVAQNVRPRQTLERGKEYTIDELLTYMIGYSDNNAYFLLYSRIDPNVLHHVYTDLGLEVPKVRQRTDYMSVQEYAAFFRILFNASYLNKEQSERAMEYLAHIDFSEGIVASLPRGITAAQKFGEASLGERGEIKQFHDCGIVYYPQHPYLLCIMTRGSSFEYLDDMIKGVSQVVFQEVDRQYSALPN